MITNTFCHVPGIGLKLERELWDAGVHSWEDVLSRRIPPRLGRRRADALRRHVAASEEHYRKRNPRYFGSTLPPDQLWRLFGDFSDSVAYIDIETNGLMGPGGYITTIALYDGKNISCYVKDRNLHEFVYDIRRYGIVVTYNGKCFDMPFLRDYLGVDSDAVHIDLRYVLKSLGFRGGLKRCEKQMGIDRGDIDGLDGYFAVLLWREFLMHDDEKALETLLAYNIQDVVSLELLLAHAYRMNLSETPFASRFAAPTPRPPDPPYRPHLPTVRKLLKRYCRW